MIIRTRILAVTGSPLAGTDEGVLDFSASSELLTVSISVSHPPMSSAMCQGSCSESEFQASSSTATAVVRA